MSGAVALRVNGRSIAEVLYPKGTIVVCRACGKPIYRLQSSIYANEAFGASAWKYAPVSMSDLDDLMDRSDLEPGQRASIKAMSLEDRESHCDRIVTPKAGDMADCPSCKEPFLFGRINEDHEGASRFGDKGYVVGLAVIPPVGMARRVQ